MASLLLKTRRKRVSMDSSGRLRESSAILSMLLSRAKHFPFRKPKTSAEAYPERSRFGCDGFGPQCCSSRRIPGVYQMKYIVLPGDGSGFQQTRRLSEECNPGKFFLFRGGLRLRPLMELSEEPFPRKNLLCNHSSGSGFPRKFSSAAQCMKHDSDLHQGYSPGSLSIQEGAVSHAFKHYAQCYWDLSKARLSMLVATTGGAGYVLGSGVAVSYCGLSWTCLGTFCVAAAANTFNQILEVENDSKMRRTKNRPLPSGRITTEHAMAWGLTTGIAGIALLASQANMIAAGLAAINLVLYTLVYTPLKQIHPVNTWVGAVVGAVPPLLGWAAAAGEVSMGGWLLASVLYFWQIPHFMAIAYLCREDYAAGGFKMLSMEDSSGRRTALAALRNCGYLVPLGYLAHQSGMTSEWFGLETALLSAGMGTGAALFYFKPSNERARKLFRISLIYLPLVMIGMLSHRHPNEANSDLDEDLTTNRGNIAPKTQLPVLLGSQQVSKPPVAYFSVAPFPFLPVPDFTPS